MKTVFVGLSGGVDSAVSAALLKGQSYNVIGAFIKIWRPEFTECPWREDRISAMRVAAALNIPFRELDLSDEYKHSVIDETIGGYMSGITPNPDILCNKHIKFGRFLQWARAQGADYIATGHYARIENVDREYRLLRGLDANKDQSYFLSQLGQQELSHTLFPIGSLTKPQVRAQAEGLGLPNAKRPDSQGLCFVGDVSMDEFLSRLISVEPGVLRNRRGRVVGTHKGAALYTKGQRHGLTNTDENSAPHYVVDVNTKKNEVIVSTNKGDAAKLEFEIEKMHWIVDKHPSTPFKCLGQVRHHSRAYPCKISFNGNATSVRFEESLIAAPGQSIVLYDDACVLGGGVINSTN